MTGLKLRGIPVESQRTKLRTQKALDILEEMQHRAGQLGLPEYPKPTNTPDPLSDVDIEALANRELEQLMATYTAWATYIMPKLAETEAAYKISASNLKAVAADLKVHLFKDGVPKSEVGARVLDSPVYMEYELEHLKLFATKEILEAHYNAYSKQAAVLSRIVELRKLEYEQTLRQQSIGNYRPKAHTSIQGSFRRT